MEQKKSNSLLRWPPEERPREKCMTLGVKKLTNAELLALLLRSGTMRSSAMDLASELLQSYDHDLRKMGALEPEHWRDHSGVGEAKAASVMAAFELGRRMANSKFVPRSMVRGSKDAFLQLWPDFENVEHEEFWVLYLNRAHRIVKKECVGQGGWTATLADLRVIFELALRTKASAIIVAHNHPSGNLAPSEQDRELTKRLLRVGSLMEISVLDHLIVGRGEYLSFADQGLLLGSSLASES
jgi:DNA repair protein RadC